MTYTYNEDGMYTDYLSVVKAGTGATILARETLAKLLQELRHFDVQIGHHRELAQLASHGEPAQRLRAIDDIAPITSTALVASVGNAQTSKAADSSPPGSA